jgi:hypothetical protein
VCTLDAGGGRGTTRRVRVVTDAPQEYWLGTPVGSGWTGRARTARQRAARLDGFGGRAGAGLPDSFSDHWSRTCQCVALARWVNALAHVAPAPLYLPPDAVEPGRVETGQPAMTETGGLVDGTGAPTGAASRRVPRDCPTSRSAGCGGGTSVVVALERQLFRPDPWTAEMF